jgi:uncharacterized protein YbbC (DUF1343 family)
MVRNLILSFSLSLFLSAAPVELGIDRFFKDGYAKELEGKRIGLITNQTGVDADLKSTVKLFLEHKNFQVTAFFAPEHGLDGKIYAGVEVKHAVQKEIPVFSLHGKTRRPTVAMLKTIDALVFDIQDVGIRPYTYASTLFYVMEEATKLSIPVIVLDRPNPMGGLMVDGPMLEESFRSFIGYINVPYCHGMTIGELARFFNAEYKIGCKLTVVPMKGWRRSMTFKETGLSWIPTSPNIPESDTPYYCATTGLLGELELVNIGIGYTLPFKIVGAPWINADLFAKALNEQKIPGVTFTPIHYTPFYGSLKNIECHGVNIHITNLPLYRPLVTQSFLLGLLKTLYPEKVTAKLKALPPQKKELFNKAHGSAAAYNFLLTEKFATWKLINHHKTERATFLETRYKYLMYPE